MIKANISWNAKQIAKAVTNGSMTFDNAIQRGHVWDKKRQSLFIDSLIRNFPVPAMFTIKTDIDAPEGCKKGSKVFDCIDGKQRSEAIRAFASDELVLTGLDTYDLNGEEFDLNGKTFSELPEEIREAFEGYTLTVYFFTEITDEEISEMMSRLNNGKPLTGVESARIKAKNLPAITRLANHDLFIENMTETARKSYNNEDVVIKTALQVFEDQFELSTKNVKNAYETLEFSDEQVERLEEIFDIAQSAIDTMRENAKKSVAKKAIRKTNLVNIIYLASQNDDFELIGDFLCEFFDAGNESYREQIDDYMDASTDGTNHAGNVVDRNKAMARAYEIFIA